ncbi:MULTISPECIES: enoyl-ACP reductase [Thermaerobacter]|uniref:Enoyl-[acyl-carrier-protein] reductase [NADH] n=1 Tax=Thermaerobacter composti TaxID=554949 RepID=A0ABZ0QKR8_9FIRM|nr:MULTISPECIES: enoyl-ACP reductase [Thermaerobacter]QBS38068.1 enoyl-ACP reductase [Thermaerobacter sp. FW80]WPD18086.1 enoyl-ACP reductase [Thermaerobacter composti]
MATTVPAGLLEGKRALVFGVANKHSIAWAIARALDAAGAELAIAYQDQRLGERVQKLVPELRRPPLLLECDVAFDPQIDAAFATVARHWDRLDVLVHSLAYAPKQALENPFVETTREDFRIALDVSAYSLVALARAARPLMKEGGSILTMTYYGAQKAVPNYNVMGVAKAALEACVRYLAADLGPAGIRVNAISAGPINTLAARGVRNLTDFIKTHAERSALRRNVTQEDVAHAALFLASDLAASITGEVLFVDAGYNVMGV